MRLGFIATIAVLATAWSCPPAAARAETRAVEPEPAITVSVPATCADVWQHVFKEFDRSWNVTVLAPSKKEQELPMSDARDQFLASVPGLDDAVANLDALDKDLFYVRVHIAGLTDLKKRYPNIDLALLERAKVQACKNMVADPARTREQRLALVHKLLSEVERSPSAYLPELRAKLQQARAEAQAVLKEDPHHPEGLQLMARIDSLLAQLAPRSLPDHPTEAQASVTLDRLEGLVKGGAPRREVEAVHTHLRQVIRRLKDESGFQGIATKYASRAKYLWELYAGRLAKLEDLCVGCPALELAALVKGFDNPRVLGAGDYSLEDLATMPEDPQNQKPGYAPLLTGDFDGDGSMDVALIGRGGQKGNDKLFVLIASQQKGQYRRVFVQPLEWDKAALAARDGNLILGRFFGPTDDFWWLRWNGKTYLLRYSGDEMGGRPR